MFTLKEKVTLASDWFVVLFTVERRIYSQECAYCTLPPSNPGELVMLRHAPSGGLYVNAGESFVTGKSFVEPTVDDHLNYAHGLN
jgi:hypothetical protein